MNWIYFISIKLINAEVDGVVTYLIVVSLAFHKMNV